MATKDKIMEIILGNLLFNWNSTAKTTYIIGFFHKNRHTVVHCLYELIKLTHVIISVDQSFKILRKKNIIYR